eukprot:CAMPEP_0197049780 /NCGR_PEP_ID=MMETSP1384-20130603/24830_1 /TAXON_ID=29189 /ORGANISM="Ammonia sp." /LENGTH=320 /DNA_ID=CAMNT_0042482107 /DNA_START=69 /DNA_END=1031 /DNA_ORIENTATION=+
MESADQDEEEDDPTSSSLIEAKRARARNDDDQLEVIPDDVLFLCFEWLFPSDLSRCMLVSKHWNDAAKDNHLWKLHCAMAFNRISSKNLSNKYASSYYEYYRRHNKLRFDGIYVLKVLYYIQSEAAMPSFSSSRKANPYTTIEYYRYLRFFNNRCEVVVHDKSHRVEKVTHDHSFHALYALSKKPPAQFVLFRCFAAMDASHENMRNAQSTSNVVAAYLDKTDGISTHEKVFRAKYDILDKKQLKVMVNTDYDLALEMTLSYYEVMQGASDRLKMAAFDGVCLDAEGNRMEDTRDHYEVRHEPFVFIPDYHFAVAQRYFD